MAGVTAALSLAAALKDQRVEGIVESLFRNDEVMGEFATRDFTGGATINITHHYAGNTSVGRYSEGDAAGVAGSQSYIVAQWGPSYYKGVIQITGHARDQLRNGDPQAAFFDQISEEFARIIPDMVHAISEDMLGTGLVDPVGVQGICDSAGSIAGLSRSTYTWFQAFEGASLTSSTVIEVADIDSATYQSHDPPYNGRVSALWTSWKQQFRYKTKIGNAGVSNSPLRINVNGGGPVTFNSGDVRDQAFYGSTPIKPKMGLTNSVWLGLTESTFFVGDMREWTVEQLGKTDDSDKFLVTRAVGLGNEDPRRNWKLTGYTT